MTSVSSSSSISVFSSPISSSGCLILNPLVNPGGSDDNGPNCVFSFILYRELSALSSETPSNPPGEKGNCPVLPLTKSSLDPGFLNNDVEFFPVRAFSTAVYYRQNLTRGCNLLVSCDSSFQAFSDEPYS
jgi:hypothetical protein